METVMELGTDLQVTDRILARECAETFIDGRLRGASTGFARAWWLPFLAMVSLAARISGRGVFAEEPSRPAAEEAIAGTSDHAVAGGSPPVAGPQGRIDLTEPFAVPRTSFFHAALGVPPLMGARTPRQGELLLRARTAHARSNEERFIDGFKNDFDGIYHEWVKFEARWAVLSWVELGVGGVFSGWDEHIDRFNLFDEAGTPIVKYEDAKILGFGATKRHDNLSRLEVDSRAHLASFEELGLDVGIDLAVKIPVGRPRDLTHAGTYDVAPTLLASLDLGRATLHANIGATVPLGEQDLFEDAADIDLNPLAHGGVGITYALTDTLATGLQFEGHTSAFTDVSFLDAPSGIVELGVRKLVGPLILEAVGGAGVDWRSSPQWLLALSLGWRI